MKGPTRRQWRGYLVLCAVLLAVLAAAVLWPTPRHGNETAGNSLFEKAIEEYADGIDSATTARRQRHYASPGTRQYAPGRTDSTARPSDRLRDDRRERLARHREEYFRSVSVELNSADTAELQRLYGIGPAFAVRIAKYRDLLGGFVRKEQLLEVYGMDTVRFSGIADNVTVDPSQVRRIAINSATLDELRRHPYLDYYQARAITDYRKKGYRIEKPDDLLLVSLIDEATVRKLQDYIQFN